VVLEVEVVVLVVAVVLGVVVEAILLCRVTVALVGGLIFFFAYGFRKSDPSLIGPVDEPAGLPDYI